MSDLLSLFGADERTPANLAQLVKPATHDDPLPPTWPANGIPPHPYSTINRMMNADEARELRADIEARGLLERIVIFEGKILDGRNRYEICVALGRFPASVDWRTHPDFVEFGGRGWDVDRGTDALGYVWSQEVRRHMSAKDMALRGARYLRFIALLRPEFPEAKTAKLRLPTQAEMSKRYGISERLLNSAIVLLDRAEPEVVAAVEQGTLALTDAADVVSKLGKDEQKQIAAEPDKKAAKAAVKAAKPKASNTAPPPELPSPVSRQVLASFAEELVLLAVAARKKHGDKAGASISADAILAAALKHELVESEAGELSRAMLLVLGKLRDTMPAAVPKQKKYDPGTGPAALPLGGEWALTIGGLKGKHNASIAVFHEADDTYSISSNYMWSTCGSSSPFHGSYPDFRGAIGVIASRLIESFIRIAERQDSVTTDAERASARGGAAWLTERMMQWGIDLVDPDLPKPPPPGVDDAFAGKAGSYAALLERSAHLKGKHTRVTAEALLRAADAEDVPILTVAADLGHPKGTIGTWRNAHQLQDRDRLKAPPTGPGGKRSKGADGLSA